MRISSLLAIVFLMLSTQSFSSTKFDYPELVVTPSASDRILMEAKKEQSKKIYEPTPLQISAATTFIASILHSGEINEQDDPDKKSGLVGMLVGGGWLAFNYFYFNKSKFYTKTYGDLKKMPGKTKAQKLAKERLAEEALRDRAEMTKKFTWISAFTNFGASMYMMSSVNKKTTAEVLDILAAITSFIPVIFDMNEVKIYETHQSYKKKIYAPLVQTKLFFDKGAQKYVPGINLSYNF